MLTVHEICKTYPRQGVPRDGLVALDKVSLYIGEGQSIALIGESGSGKSTLSRIILALEKPDSGSVLWNGEAITPKSARRIGLYRQVQPVFQNNLGCFDPRWRIYDSVTEPMRNFLDLSCDVLDAKAKELMDMVDLPSSVLKKYPHELSGGQQKRVCIARAISINPRLLVLDEAVTGLDATVMLKILRLLRRLRRELGCACLFITHDIRAALYIADTVAVMRRGVVLETAHNVTGPDDFRHPFSKMLLQHNNILEEEKDENKMD